MDVAWQQLDLPPATASLTAALSIEAQVWAAKDLDSEDRGHW